MRPISIAIVGSCVSRDAFAFLPAPGFQIASYLARQSFAGLTRPPLPFDPKWYEGLSGFEQNCVLADLGKTDDYWRFETSDILIVDYIDERFDLLSAGESLVSDTRHIRQPGFEQAYSPKILKRDSDDVFNAWRSGAAVFFDRAKKALPERRIVLHEAYWAPGFRDKSGKETPFPAYMADRVARNNHILQNMHQYTRSEMASVSIIKPAQGVLFADPEHKWSKEPFHYVNEYYREFMDQLRKIVMDLQRDGLIGN